MALPTPDPLIQHWTLDPAVTFLNHGSFGACPREVLEEQTRLRARLEAEPVRFMDRELEGLLDAARVDLAAFVGADPQGLAFVPNATAGVNAVLRSLSLQAGDELLITDHAYGACRNTLDFVAARSGAQVVVAAVPFPIDDAAQVVEAVMAAVTHRTRLALLDHVTSPTGLVFPMARLVAALRERGVETLVDGAHVPGMLDLDVQALGAAYYTGNCHKWLCAPKGAAFLFVRADRREGVRPLSISHGATIPAQERSRFHLEFDWTGTSDPTAALCVPAALRFMGALLPGGWPALRKRNHELVKQARALLCSSLGVEPPAPNDMLGSLAAVLLPPGGPPVSDPPPRFDPLRDALLFHHAIEVPVLSWFEPSRRILRVSAQAYNSLDQYHYLVRSLAALGLGKAAS